MEDFLIYLLKSAGLLSLFFLSYQILLKQDTSFVANRKFLLGGLIISAVLPAIVFTKTIYIDAVPATSFFIAEEGLPVTEITTAPAISLPEIFLLIYLAGVFLLFGRLLLQLFSLALLLFKGKITTRGQIKYVEIDRRLAPFSFLNFIVYNPNLHSDKELEHILKHEKVHVSQWHTIDVLIANLNLLYQWFNPFAWLYLRNLQQNLEFIADREAVKAVSCKKEYQKALVKISVENFNLALTNNFYQSLIKKRILMLNKASQNKNTSWKAVLILPLLLAFIFLFNVRTEAQVREPNDTQITGRASDADISFSITANTKQEQLDLYKKLAAKHNVLLEFSEVRYNEKDVLTAINANFIDKETNTTGSMNRENPDGIKTFVFHFGPKGTGFISNDSPAGRTAKYALQELEVDPLYIINGKNYSSSELDDKAIKVQGEVFAVSPEEAMKKYGAEAKSGALIISSGIIIEDFQAELKKIDQENAALINEYVRIEKGKKPMVIGLNNSPGKHKVIRESKPSSSGKVINIKNLNTDGKDPIYILNGKVLKDDETLLKISTENIDSIQVLKGKNAVRHYGKGAKDGAILIYTKKDSTGNAGTGSLKNFRNNKVIVSTGPTFTKDRNISITSARTIKNDTTYSRDSSFVKLREFRVNKDSVDIIATQYGTRTFPQRQVIVNNQGPQPLYVINGEVMKNSFDMKSLKPENISAINVLKDAAATRMYGEKAKHGVIVVTTKNAGKKALIGNNDLGIVNPSTTDEELEGIKSRLKDAGVNIKFEKVKRNRGGLLTSIKISARTSTQNASATFEVNDGIPPVYVGLINKKLVVSSNPPGH
ncbi:hypothetical protein FHG64_05020 [Antarcticibacterium flavum]|uniref:Peptidase M56 domain-containing protein n=1 Tax=Antarcticibacterium flavum TaxID=2058175 RepID=A0A5B7X0P3_9FLAO|nr:MULTISPECIES: M56 family metallopeptidase [Antarcticibacterium]MCM4160712.1 hypothetical protein [Antarcticibacterium sp. W02-3]QCY68810.1 hypothetical protein FHG64_05020 [Antarcticibacterium flavum]